MSIHYRKLLHLSMICVVITVSLAGEPRPPALVAGMWSQPITSGVSPQGIVTPPGEHPSSVIHHAKSVFSLKRDQQGNTLPSRAAVIFRGGHQMNRKLGEVTYQCCLPSHVENLIQPLRNLGMEIDSFLATYNSTLLPQLQQDTAAKATWILDKANNQVHGFWTSLKNLNEYSKQNNVHYDLIILVRFDTTVKVPLVKFNVEREKFYFLWRELDEKGTTLGWKKKRRVSDIFHVLTGDVLEKSIGAVKLYMKIFPQGRNYAHMHFMFDPMAKSLGKDHVGFLYDGYCWSNSESAPNGFFDFAGRQTGGEEKRRKTCDAK